ncbi:MarR family transcriptional regulator [Microbacterium sp. ISL-103]|nr:MarR family transcriptional regulator [Microbacterium sp. ISL-103]
MRALLARERSSPSDVATYLGVGRSTVSNLLARMERAGLVSRSSGGTDKREVQVVPSEKAITAFMTFDATSAEIVADAVALTLSAAEEQILEDAIPVLEKLRQAIAAAPKNEERRTA